MQKGNYNTTGLVETGLVIAMLVVLSLINIYVPLFTALGRFILPIPVTVIYLRQDIKMTVLSIIGSGIIIALLYNPIAGITSAIMFGITGVTLGYCIKNRKKISTTILFLSLASLIGSLIQLIAYIRIIANTNIQGFFEEVVTSMRESFQLIIETYSSIGMSEEQLKPFYDLLKSIKTEYILKVAPALLILSAFLFAYFTYIITKSILKKLGYEMRPMTSISYIRIDIKFTTIVAIILLIGVILVRNNMLIGEYLSVSSQILLQYIFVIEGIAVVVYFLKYKFHIGNIFIILITVFIFFSAISTMYILLGLADIILDIRKIDPNRRILKK